MYEQYTYVIVYVKKYMMIEIIVQNFTLSMYVAKIII